MLGRTSRPSPQFIIISDGSWFGTSVCIERTTHRRSADSATCGKSSLTSIPLWPYFWKENGEGNAAPVLRSVRYVTGRGLPAYLASSGLGSNVSTCDGPPFMNRWMTRFALPGNCEFFGASGDWKAAPTGSVAEAVSPAQQTGESHGSHAHAPSAENLPA